MGDRAQEVEDAWVSVLEYLRSANLDPAKVVGEQDVRAIVGAKVKDPLIAAAVIARWKEVSPSTFGVPGAAPQGLHRGESLLPLLSCSGSLASDILAYIQQVETEHGGKMSPLVLRPLEERTKKACCDHPLVPEPELEMMPNLLSRDDALGYSLAVFNDRLRKRSSVVEMTRQDTQLAVYGTPGIGKTRFLEELAKINPESIPKYIEYARTHLPADVLSKVDPGSFAGEGVDKLQEAVSGWVAVAVTYNSNTPYDKLIDSNPERGLALRMLYAHFFKASKLQLAFVSRAFPDVGSVIEAAKAIIRDHWQLEVAESEKLLLALLLVIDELVLADGPPDDPEVHKAQHRNALAIVHVVGSLQEHFWGQASKDGDVLRYRAVMFTAISTLDKVVVGLTTPESRRLAIYVLMRLLHHPASAARQAVRQLVESKEEYRTLFFDSGRWPRGALYCAECAMSSGEGAWSINELEKNLFLRLRNTFTHYGGDETRLRVVLTHALCSHALERSEPLPGLPLPRTEKSPTTLADLVAKVVYDGIELAPKDQQVVGAGGAVLDTYVPFLTPVRLLLYAGYDPRQAVPTREALGAAAVAQYVAQQRQYVTSMAHLKSEILIGLRGGKAGERFQDGHEFERLLIMRLGLCPSLRRELALLPNNVAGSEGMAADELLSTLFGGDDALCNDRTREWLGSTTLLCQHRRVVVSFAGSHVSKFLGQLRDTYPSGQAMAEALDDVVLYPEPQTNNPGFEMIAFAQARGSDGKLMRVAIGVEARCSKVTACDAPSAVAAQPKEKRPELDMKVDVIDKHNNALIQAGLAPKPKSKPKRKANPLPAARAPKRARKSAAAKSGTEAEADAEVKAEAEVDAEVKAEEEVDAEAKAGAETASPVPDAAVFEPKGWALHPNNGFDRFLFVVVSNRASSKINATDLPDDTVVVAHTALHKMLGNTLYMHSRLDAVHISDVLHSVSMTKTQSSVVE